MIRIERISESTFSKVLDMKLSEEQNQYVAPNIVSMAQAWLYYDEARPYAVCNDDEVVGFLMLSWAEDERVAGIWRFMIATEHQHKGYGRQALQSAIEIIKAADKFDMIKLDYVPGNTNAQKLYYSLGFRENGDVEDGEIIMTMPLTDHPKIGTLVADMEDFEDFLELIHSEEEKGTKIPIELSNQESLEKSITDKQVKRYTIMGKTVGLSIGDITLMKN